MTIYFVRHAHAGQRGEWQGADADRPLSEKGWTQAARLADRLGDRPISAVLSSPAVRCAQTVEPLAVRLGLNVEIAEDLAEGSSPVAAIETVAAQSPGDVVACSHGDVIPEVVEALARRGMEIDGEVGWSKAGWWEITVTDDEFVAGRYNPPPS